MGDSTGVQIQNPSSVVLTLLVYRPKIDSAARIHNLIVWYVLAAEKNKEKAAAKKRKAEPAGNAKKMAAAK